MSQHTREDDHLRVAPKPSPHHALDHLERLELVLLVQCPVELPFIGEDTYLAEDRNLEDHTRTPTL